MESSYVLRVAWGVSLVVLPVAGAAWHGRTGYGRSRGLPPGSLGIGGSIRSLVDDRFYLAQAARHGPVFKTAQFHRPVVCIVGRRPW